MIYSRHSQSEARGPHVALQLIFAALGPLNYLKKVIAFSNFLTKMFKNDPKIFFCSTEMMSRLNNAARGHN
jgi:hypothetical protein